MDLNEPSTSNIVIEIQIDNRTNINHNLKPIKCDTDLSDEAIKNTENEITKVKQVKLYAEDTGPKIYDIKGNLVSRPIIPENLPEAFSCLPVFGRCKNKAGLAEFQENKIKEFVGSNLSDEEFKDLSNYCRPDHLKTGNELMMITNYPRHGLSMSEMDAPHKLKNDNGADLFILKKHKRRLDDDIKNIYLKKMKYRGIKLMPLTQEDDDTMSMPVTLGEPLQPGKDLLFRVRVYRPFAYNPKQKLCGRRQTLFSCDIVLLGRHKLTTLRDRIVCPNDVDMRVDVSERPDDLPPSTAKELFPSGFLFINNAFYVDSRAGCRDTSAPLRAWAAARGLGAPPCRDLAARLDRLPLRLGHPEVYIHQGNCEHLFTFSEIRLLNATDPLKLSQYPCHTAVSQHQTVYCTTCAEFGAKWIVVGCERVPFDPAFFCDKCFKMYLYKDGQKIGQFKAYSYRGNEINVLKPQS
ncbi:proximal sequence element A Pbp49 [Aphomia sociella]